MTELLTAAQMRAIEQAAIESGEVTGLELMERAGRGVVEAIFEEWPELDEVSLAAGREGGSAPSAFGIHPRDTSGQKKRRAVVLCGPGNNGGDGFVVARLLHERGWEVEVFLYGDAEKLPPDARVNYERWGELGEVTHVQIDPPALSQCVLKFPDSFDILIDALFGTGLTRPFSGPISAFAERAFRPLLKVPLVSVDIPSGLNSDNGAVLDRAFRADLTVTFHQRKLGHEIGDGPEFCGKVVVKDIGL